MTEREGKTEILHPLVHSPFVHNKQGWASLKSETASGSPTWMKGIQVPKPSSSASQAREREAELEAGNLGLEQGIQIWDMDVPVSGLTHCATVPFVLR